MASVSNSLAEVGAADEQTQPSGSGIEHPISQTAFCAVVLGGWKIVGGEVFAVAFALSLALPVGFVFCLFVLCLMPSF